MRVPLKLGCQKSNFPITHARHMQFLGLANMKKKKKFNKIWVYQNQESPSNGAAKIPTF